LAPVSHAVTTFVGCAVEAIASVRMPMFPARRRPFAFCCMCMSMCGLSSKYVANSCTYLACGFLGSFVHGYFLHSWQNLHTTPCGFVEALGFARLYRKGHTLLCRVLGTVSLEALPANLARLAWPANDNPLALFIKPCATAGLFCCYCSDD
jgi:hypothetical protein